MKKLEFGKGDFVVSKWTTTKPYRATAVFLVVDIDELHHYVEWAPPDVGPLALNLQSIFPNCKVIKGGANMYQKVSPEDVPAKWKEWIENNRPKLTLVKP